MITALDIKAAIHDWKMVLQHFGINRDFLSGRHSPCPYCGGRDRFRYDNKHGNGDYFCNGCGAGDGLSLIQKVNGLDFAETAQQLINYLGLKDNGGTYRQSKYKQQQLKKEYDKAKIRYALAVSDWKKGKTFSDEDIEIAKAAGKIVREYESSHAIR